MHGVLEFVTQRTHVVILPLVGQHVGVRRAPPWNKPGGLAFGGIHVNPRSVNAFRPAHIRTKPDRRFQDVVFGHVHGYFRLTNNKRSIEIVIMEFKPHHSFRSFRWR